MKKSHIIAAATIAVTATLLSSTAAPVTAAGFELTSSNHADITETDQLMDNSLEPDANGGFVNSQTSTQGTPVTTIFTSDGYWYQPRIPVPTPGISYRKYSNRWYTISTRTADTILTKAIDGIAGSFGGVAGSLAASELLPSNIFKTSYTYEHLILSYARDSRNTYIKMEGWAYKDKAHKHLLYHNTSYQKVPRK